MLLHKRILSRLHLSRFYINISTVTYDVHNDVCHISVSIIEGVPAIKRRSLYRSVVILISNSFINVTRKRFLSRCIITLNSTRMESKCQIISYDATD